MREIKFRGYSDGLFGKGMHYGWGCYIKDPTKLYIIQDNDRIRVSALMQCTDLHDKNGKEIYEGDILVVFDDYVLPVTDEGYGPVEAANHLVPVEMRNGVWGFEIPVIDDGTTGWFGIDEWNEEISSEGFEIIGNIYENPDLLPTHPTSEISD